MNAEPSLPSWAVGAAVIVLALSAAALVLWLVTRRAATKHPSAPGSAPHGSARRPLADGGLRPVNAGGVRAVEVTHEQAPALFAVMGEAAAALGVPPVRRILVTEDIDTSVDVEPPTGVLRVGLMMLATFAPDEARAEIARALTTLAVADGTVVRPGAMRDHLQGPEREQAWRDVHRVDALAARVAGTGAAARALVRVEALTWYGVELIRDQVALAADHPHRPFTGEFSYHRDLLAGARLEGRAGRWLTAQMDPPESEFFSWPPPLGPRLRAIGVAVAPAEALRPAEHTAAREWLGDTLAGALAAEFDRHGDGYLTTEWPRWHREARDERRRLAELDARAAVQPLAPGEALERAHLAALHRRGQARELYAALADESPEARSALGRLMLQDGDDHGIAHLERVAAENPEWAVPALEDIATYLQETGRGARAAEFRRRAGTISRGG